MAKRYVDGIGSIILERINILDVVGSYVTLKKAGRNHKALCPFHSEKTPSFVVSEDKQIYHCFGCGASGNAIGFVMAMDHLDFIDAIEVISERYGISLDEYQVGLSDPRAQEEKDRILSINKIVANAFYRTFKENPQARDYMAARGIAPETLRRYGVGYARDEWDFVLKNLSGKYPPELLEKAGLVIRREGSKGYYDRFRNRIIFPILDVRGRVIGFGGRVLDDSLPKYLNSPDTPVFNKSFNLYGLNFAKNHLDEDKRILLVEGYMDVIALGSHGIYNAVASLGTSLTEGHGRLLERYAREVVLVYDGDEAGIKATNRAIEVLGGFNLKLKVLNLPEGMDPDDYLKMNSRESFLELSAKARDAIEYLLDYYARGLNFGVKSQLLEYIDRIKPVFQGIKDPLAYELYLKKVAQDTDFEVASLKKSLKSSRRSSSESSEKGVQSPSRQQPSQMKLYQRILDIIIHEREYLDFIKESFDFSLLDYEPMVEVLKYLLDHESIRLEDAIDTLSYEAMTMIEASLDGAGYMPVVKGRREVEKSYLQMQLGDLKNKYLKIKKEKDDVLLNIDKESQEYATLEMAFESKLQEINGIMMKINKKIR
ncbi:MAG: hypothetical protein AVO33_01195 [delta proteobacterium ML8_F1]|nr:MAG: hypothetical protein AVO33_01195 [delta proteobacterium ML8_F1]